MLRVQIESALDKGQQLGFVKPTDDERVLGWILLWKRKPHDRYLALLRPGEEPDFVAKQEAIRRCPFYVSVIELSRDVHESGDYETEEDYRLKEIHQFPDLDAVDTFVRSYGFQLDRITWGTDIDAP